MAKYDPLSTFLKTVTDRSVSLTFARIEEILGDALPPSATNHRAWWANESDGKHVHASAWLRAGWEVEALDQERGLVTFRRR
jgi:hypothetical protein